MQNVLLSNQTLMYRKHGTTGQIMKLKYIVQEGFGSPNPRNPSRLPAARNPVMNFWTIRTITTMTMRRTFICQKKSTSTIMQIVSSC